MNNFKIDSYLIREETNSSLDNHSKIDKMKIRRLHSSDKLSLSDATSLLEEYSIDYIIYSSFHGQINLSTELITSILKLQDLSPASFSLSVHNSPAGMLTILQNAKVPHTSICAGPRSFLTGLELAGIKANQGMRVLYLYTEYSLPELYQNIDVENFNFSFTGIISSSNDSDSLSFNRLRKISLNLPIKDQINQVTAVI